MRVIGDQDKLVNVVSNLVDNAIKYSPAGGPVTLATSVCDGSVRLSVRDEGLGIAAPDQERIFGRFQRISRSQTESIRSTGLGLYMVEQIVTRMNGTVAVTSRVGAGSTFTVSLPAALEHGPVARTERVAA